MTAVITMALCGCKEWAEIWDTEPLRPTRGVLVISLDTLRADHLGAWGYDRATSPFLDSLAAQGMVFENAIAQFPSTLTSHMCIFTGLYPGEHGVYPPDAILAHEIPTLPEFFQTAGYRTGGFTEGALMSGRFGFDRGFDVFNDNAKRHSDDIERTFDRAVRFLDSIGPKERFFLFVHTYQIHDPYDPPEPYASMFWEGPAPETFPPDAPHLVHYNNHDGPLPEGTVEYFEALYDGSIRYTDDQLRAFFAELEERGLRQDLTVVILSDHGEQFLEHGEFVHSALYHEVLHVPLIVLHPQLEPQRVRQPVELVDVLPTLLTLSGIATEAEFSGEVLLDEDGFLADRVDDTAYAEKEAGRRSRTLYRQQEDALYQLILHRKPPGEWWGRTVTLAMPEGRKSIRVGAFRQPRQVAVRLDGERLGVTRVFPSGTSIPIPLGKGIGRRLVTLTAADCTPPRLSTNACLALRVLEPKPRYTELFAVWEDPLERHDLSERLPDLRRDLLRSLLRITHTLRGTPLKKRLEEGLEAELRALGYL